MARRKAAAARRTKTATARRGTRKSATRTAAARKSRATPQRAARKTASRRAKPVARKAAAKKTARKAPAKAAKATRKSTPVRKSAAARKTARPVTRRKPALDRERRRLSGEDIVQSTPPSSLDMDRHATAARSGAAEMEERLEEHTETGPAITAGDVDADWESAYSVGDEAPGGDNPTPDQDVVEDIGKALGVEYQDNEELKSSDKIAQRDKRRWELDPASSDDWTDR